MVAKHGSKKRRAPSPAGGKKATKKLRADEPEPIVANDGARVVSRGISFKDLDLDTSYVGKVLGPDRSARPGRQEWEYVEEDISAGKLPMGWNYEEPDLDKQYVLILSCTDSSISWLLMSILAISMHKLRGAMKESKRILCPIFSKLSLQNTRNEKRPSSTYSTSPVLGNTYL